MARCMPLDDQDKAALRVLDDFTVSDDGKTATLAGEMKVEIVRPVPINGRDQFWLTISLPGGEEFAVKMPRTDLLEAAGIEADEAERRGK
jgi:hypothetical protein